MASDGKGSNGAASQPPPLPYIPSAVAPTSTAAVASPRPEDFVIPVIVTSEHCFGSAGCNYKYTINPQYISSNPLPDKTTVVFSVTGGDEDQVGSSTIDKKGTATFQRESSLQGQEGAQLTAKATQVLPY
jgi:hypothetical protein